MKKQLLTTIALSTMLKLTSVAQCGNFPKITSNGSNISCGPLSATLSVPSDDVKLSTSLSAPTSFSVFGGGRSEPFAFSIGCKGYVGAGAGYDANLNVEKTLNDFWEFDPITETWSQKANFPSGRRGAIGFSIGNYGYAGGGANSSGTYQTGFYRYDPTTNTWLNRANTPVARWLASGASDGTYGYMLGGYEDLGLNPNNGFYQYDPTANTWATKATFGGGNRAEATMFAINGNIYAGMGYATSFDINNNPNSTNIKNDFWAYNAGTNTWNQKANCPATAKGPFGFGIGSKGYVFGGYGLNNFYFREYDPTNDSWTQRKLYTATSAVYKGGAFVIGNVAYFGFGNSGPSDVGGVIDLRAYYPLNSSIVWSTGATTNTLAINPSVNTVYTATATSVTGLTGTSNSYSVIISNGPSIAVSSATLCPNVSYTLSPTGATNYSYSPTGPVISPSVSTAYTISGTDVYGCVGSKTVTIYVAPLLAPTPGNLLVCNGATIADLTAVGQPSAVIKWYAANTGGLPLAGTTTVTSGTTYYASQTSNGCESNRAAATPTVQAATPAPYRYKVNVSLNYTGFGPPTDCYSSNNQHLENGLFNGKKRFTVSGSDMFGPFTSEVKYTGTNWVITYNSTTYFTSSATGINNFPPTTGWTGGCTNVSFTSLSIDSLKTTYCAGSVLSQITGIGQGIKWYTAATGGSLLGADTIILANNTHYYASQTINGCESSVRLDFVPQLINSTYSITSTQGASVCGPISSQDFTLTANANGGTVNWFSTPNLTTYDIIFGVNPIATGTTVVASEISSTTIKYATAYDGTCYSYPRVAVTVSVTVTPKLGDKSLDVTITGLCGSGTPTHFVFDSLINGKNKYIPVPNPSNIYLKFNGTKWVYGAYGFGNAFENTNVLANTFPSTTGWTSIGSCTGSNLVVSNIINQDVPSTFCTGATLANVVVVGAQNIKWYSAITGGTVLPSTTTMVNGTHYYGTQTMNGCESQTRYDLTATIVAPPTASITATATTACAGGSIVLNATTGAGYTYVWKKDGTVLNGVTTSSYNANASGSYVVEVSANGCSTISSPVSLIISSPAAPTGASYEPLVLTGFNQDVVANGTDYTNSTTTSVDANTDGCRFIDSTYTQFGTPTRYLPGGGAFYSQEPTTPGLPFQFASYTANNALTLQTGSMTGTLSLATPKKMDAFYLLATGGGGASTVNYTITFTDASTQTATNLSITDWFNGSNAAIKGTGRYYNNALGFQAPTDNNPRLYQFLININATNQNKLVQSVAFARTNTGAMKAQIMGMTAVTVQKFCALNNPTVANLTATGSGIQWFSLPTGGTPLAPTTALVNNSTYYASQTVNGCSSNTGGAILVKVNAAPTRTVSKANCNSYTWPINNQTYNTTGTYTSVVTATSGCDSIISLNLTINTLPTITVNNGTVCSGSSFTMVANGGTSYVYSSGSSIVSPTTNNSYTVTGTDANGCSNVAISNVVVNSLPNVVVNSGAICVGSTFTMNATGANSYVYSSGSNMVSPTTNNQYTVTGTDANNCVNTAVSNVTVNAIPTISAPSTTICAGSSVVLNASGANTYTWNTGAITSSLSVSPTANTSYTVNGTSAAGCKGSAIVTNVTIGTAPSVAVNSSTLCAGNSATLTANGLTTYTWSNGSNATSIVVTPTANVTYTVSGNLTGCSTGASNVSNVTVNALPSVLASTSNTLLCVGQTASLTASGANTYVWNTSATTAIIAVNPTSTTVYTVTGTGTNGCAKATTITQNVSTCTDINAATEALDATMHVYPNPTNGILNVDLGTTTENGKVELLNALGQVLLTETTNIQHVSFNMNHLADGIYFLRANVNNSSKTIRIIKN